MSTKYRLVLDDGEGDRAVIAGELAESDVATLNRFLDQYEELVDSAPMQKGIPCELTIHAKDGQGEIATNLPSQDDLDILFQRLRLFVLQKERTSFVKVCAILRRQFTDLRLTELIKDQYAAFHNDPEHLGTTLIINEVRINQEEMLMDWIYGYQYHGDDDRRDRLKLRGIDIRQPSIRHKLVSLLLNKQDAIISIAAVVGVLMGRNPSFDIYGAILAPAATEDT